MSSENRRACADGYGVGAPFKQEDGYGVGAPFKQETEASESALNDLLCFGDVVLPVSHPLRSGCNEYTHAIVVCTKPLVLVSELADMRWESTVQGYIFKVVGKAKEETIKTVLTRLEA